MKIRLTTVLAISLAAGMAQADDKDILKDQKAKVSYGIGVNLGSQWRQQEVDVDVDLILKGMKDAMAGKETLMTEAEVRQALTAFQQEHRARQMEKRKQLGEKNKTDGEKFLAENKTKAGVKTVEVTLPDGKKSELQYKVLAEGSGASPRSNDTVTVHYRGTLIDGTEFDSSAKTGQPLVRPANALIRGWTEALQLMKPGAKWQLFIPSELAYGERGSGQQIAPNAALIFDVELLSFAPPPQASAVQPGSQPVVTSDIIKVPSKEELEKGAKIEVIKAEDVERIQKEEAEKRKKQEEQKKPEKK
ncbi:MAG TPA: FKBP-type peptidyl-prolyl cis-trans isomerase [Verrucomicrobiae bacterium]|nr:FKBP-type peptidyl-prolyl cis-trans isomerase [Verrucomicrobiae bacterium]